MDESPYHSDYDHALTFLFWSWGSASGFSDGTGENGGFYEHRSKTTKLLLSMVKAGNPWAPNPKTGRCAADLLWISQSYPASEFSEVMEACLTHPQAPPPNTWSTRPVFNAKSGPHDTADTWISAMVRHPHGPALAMKYVHLGGRLDALDGHGNGLLSNCSQQDWDKIELFMSAAQHQQASLMASPEGSWTHGWKHMAPSQLADAQKQVGRLGKKYPAATRALVSPVDEMAFVIRNNGGMRPTAAAWKALDMEKLVKTDPIAFEAIFTEVLALGVKVCGEGPRLPSSTTLSYMSGAMAKASAFHPNLCKTHKTMAAGLSFPEKHRQSFQLLSGGNPSIPSHPHQISQWFDDMETLCHKIDTISQQSNPKDKSSSMKKYLDYVFDVFSMDVEGASPEFSRAFVNTILEEKPSSIPTSSRLRYIDLLDLMRCCTEDLPPAQRDYLFCQLLGRLPQPSGSNLGAVALACQGKEPRNSLDGIVAAQWFCRTLETYLQEGAPDMVSQALSYTHEVLDDKRKTLTYNIQGLEEVSAYLGSARLSLISGKTFAPVARPSM